MGRGWGRGRGGGRGRGWRHGFFPMGVPGEPASYRGVPAYAPISGEHEAQALRAQAEHLEGTLDELRKRLAELEANQKQEA